MPMADFYNRRVVGEWMGAWSTGVLAATLVADAPIASIRCGPTQGATDAIPTQTGVLAAGVSTLKLPITRVFVTGIGLKFAGTVAFTAAQQFGLYLQRFSGANMAGGAASNPLSLNTNSATKVPSVCLPGGTAAGDLRASTTAVLTVAGVSLDGIKIPVYGWTTVGPAEYAYTYLDLAMKPIRLDAGEGLGLFNQIVWPAAGTGVLTATIYWDEAND